LCSREASLVAADISKVWDALTNPDLTQKYAFALRVFSHWKVGSPVIWQGIYEGRKIVHKGQVLKIEKEKLLQITDYDALGKLVDVPSNYTKVTYELAVEGDHKTRLNITEEDFRGDQTRLNDAASFWDTILPKLKNLLES
jgi:uncharacterized protein YndB with AHSA1/START domain